MTTGERIKQARLACHMTQNELADKIGVKYSAIHKYENGLIINFKSGIIEALSNALDVTPTWLMGYEEVPTSPAALRIPVLGKVAAGLPITATENILDWEEVPASLGSADELVALQIKGDSMLPRISEGDVVIVKRTPQVESGDIAVVIINGDEATVKKIQIRDDGILLQPFNPTYAPMFFSCADVENKPVTIYGKVIELRAKF